ncbi:MAG: hypothetical protein MZV64_47045 [Ignavibacteriales bacterium]|nr:hypothetical protein [Ignavibacteriales bacterium]
MCAGLVFQILLHSQKRKLDLLHQPMVVADWNVLENAFPMNGIVGILTTKQSIRVNGLPRMAVDLIKYFNKR